MPTEADLRHTLATLADQAPPAAPVLARLARLPGQPQPKRRHRARWIAVGAVAAATAAIAVIVPLAHPSQSPAPGQVGTASTTSAINPVSQPIPSPTSGPAVSNPPGSSRVSVVRPDPVSTASASHLATSHLTSGSNLPVTTLSTNIVAGTAVGVAFTPSLTFPTAVTERVSVTTHLHVTVNDVAADGAWVWAHDPSSPSGAITARFRPATYWNAGVIVTITAELAGIALNATRQGSHFSASFTVRPDGIISTLDVHAGTLTVAVGAHILAHYRALDPIQATGIITDGIHAISAAYPTRSLYSSTGSSVEKSTWVVRFTDAGGRIEATPDGNIRQPGRVRLSATDAEGFFRLSKTGDPINIINGDQPVTAGDGDWSYTYPQWLQLATASQN